MNTERSTLNAQRPNSENFSPVESWTLDVGRFPRPRKLLVPIEAARQWSPDQYLIQRKYDGEFAVKECQMSGVRCQVLGELVRPKSGGFFNASDRALLAAHGEFFAAFTVASVDGVDVLHRSTRERWRMLLEIVRKSAIIHPQSSFTLATPIPALKLEKIEPDVEGYVAHDWNAPWGDMLAVKQGGIWLCRVTETGSAQSVAIEHAENAQLSTSNFQPGTSAGRVKLGGGKCDQVRVGSLIRVEGMGLTDAGKIREPRACREWLVQY